MPHITYFTTTELFFYYLQIESISAIIIIIRLVNKTSFNYTPIPNCNRRRCFPFFSLENFRIRSLSSFIYNDHFIRFIMSFSLSFSVYVIPITHAFSAVFLQSLSLSLTRTQHFVFHSHSIDYLFNIIQLKQCDSIRIVYGSAPFLHPCLQNIIIHKYITNKCQPPAST